MKMFSIFMIVKKLKFPARLCTALSHLRVLKFKYGFQECDHDVETTSHFFLIKFQLLIIFAKKMLDQASLERLRTFKKDKEQ